MPIRVQPSTQAAHEQLAARTKPGKTNPAFLEALQIIKGGGVAILEYDTDQERLNIARQMGRLAAREGLTPDIRYPATGSYVSVGRGQEPYTPKPKPPAGNGRRRRRAESGTPGAG